MTKEPDSLKWIDAMAPGSVFWDIAANVGVLTLYAATRGDLKVWAFEPVAVNYFNLVANCELNHLKDRIRCLQLGFGHNHKIANLHVSQFMPVRSFTFKQSKKPDAKRKSVPSIQAVQLSTSSSRDTARCPNYLKIDAPSFTPEIFVGAWKTLANPALRQIQVEIKKSKGDPRIAELLAQFGFKPVGQEMRPGQVQRDLVFARDISRPNAPTTLAPGANTEVAYRRGAAEPSR